MEDTLMSTTRLAGFLAAVAALGGAACTGSVSSNGPMDTGAANGSSIPGVAGNGNVTGGGPDHFGDRVATR